MIDPNGPVLPLVVCAVAVAYALVGHGGASAYLALFALTGLPQREIQVAALCLNIVVAAIAFLNYRQAKAFSWRLTWPFLLGAAPTVYLAGSIRLTDDAYSALVGIVVVFAGVRMLLPRPQAPPEEELQPPPVWLGSCTGGAIGILSGLVSVGGGIFLSPVTVLARWADARHTAATSSLFILANSTLGLAARAPTGLPVPSQFPWVAAGAAVGALAGSWLGAKKLSVDWLRRSLGTMLIVAGAMTLATLGP